MIRNGTHMRALPLILVVGMLSCGRPAIADQGTFVDLRRDDEGWRVEKKLTVWVE